MAATIIINRLTGAGPTATPITSINTRVLQNDTHATGGTSNPIPAVGTFNATPGSGSAAVSCWCNTRLECTVAPSNNVTNLKWYTDGSNSLGTGTNVKGNTATAYVQSPTTNLTQGAAGELRSANYATLTAEVVDVFTFTSGSPKSVTGSTSTTQQFGDRMVFQIIVDSSASPGTTTTETATWQYDET